MSSDFTCKDCGLHGHVSGGGDAGMVVTVQTVYCKRCDKLTDVVSAWVKTLFGSKATLSKTEERLIGQCETCRTYPDIEWNKGEPCPKCGGQVEDDRDGMAVMWD